MHRYSLSSDALMIARARRFPFERLAPPPPLVFEFFHGENRDVCFMGIYFHDEILDSIDAVELNEE